MTKQLSIKRSASAMATLLVASMIAVGTPAFASNGVNTFGVSANLSSSCSISGSTLNFGTGIDPIQAAVPLNATSTLSVTCSNTTPYIVALDAGTHAGGTSNFSARKIQNGTSTLGYQLYTDAAHLLVWGNGIGTVTSIGIGTGSTQAVSIYGQLPDLTGAIPGTYTDTVTVTITY